MLRERRLERARAPAGGRGAHRLRDRHGRVAGLRVARVRRVREPEVDDERAPVAREEDVVRLEVAMDDPRRVRRRETAPGVEEDGDNLAPCAGRLEPRAERPPFDELHRDEDLLAVGADVVHGDDVGVGEAGHRLRFTQEARTPFTFTRPGGAGLVVAKELHRELAIELRVVRRIDDTHAPFPDAIEDDVAAERGAADERDGVSVGFARRERTGAREGAGRFRPRVGGGRCTRGGDCVGKRDRRIVRQDGAYGSAGSCER